jgi:2-oxo-4-hydroxy-4-carboxy-5-ureidoimidazoline decarboxylase
MASVDQPMQDQPRGDQPGELSLAELNELPARAADEALVSCCAAPAWVSAVVAGRPYQSVDALLARSDSAVAGLTDADLGAALAGHPRIGDRQATRAGWSRQEQSGVAAADTELMQALAEGNTAYEERYGHIYLVCATGRTGPELLAFLRDRLRNDRDTEWLIVAAELAKINRIRLSKLVGTGDSP